MLRGPTYTHKVVVFGHHKAVLDGVMCGLVRHSVRAVRIDGETLVRQRVERIRDFNTDPGIRVAIISVTAGGQVEACVLLRVSVVPETMCCKLVCWCLGSHIRTKVGHGWCRESTLAARHLLYSLKSPPIAGNPSASLSCSCQTSLPTSAQLGPHLRNPTSLQPSQQP